MPTWETAARRDGETDAEEPVLGTCASKLGLRGLRFLNQALSDPCKGHSWRPRLMIDGKLVAASHLAGCDKACQRLNQQPVNRTLQMPGAVPNVRAFFE